MDTIQVVWLAIIQGVTEFLAKPFTAKQLCSRITHVIDSPRDFIEAQEFTGPDRRRKMDGYGDVDRRVDTPSQTWSD